MATEELVWLRQRRQELEWELEAVSQRVKALEKQRRIRDRETQWVPLGTIARLAATQSGPASWSAAPEPPA
jgi:hypothetical protein